MIPRLAIAFAVVGACIGGYFWWRGPAIETTAEVLRWSSAPLDAGSLDVQFSVGGVQFIRAADAEIPMLSVGVLRRGQQLVVLEELNAFHAVEVHDGRLWALGENETEGPGPSLELLVSDDAGVFTRRSVPKPSYLATFEAWRVDGNDVRLELSLDDEVFANDAWSWLPPSLQPVLRSGHFTLHSRNGGRTWRLER